MNDQIQLLMRFFECGVAAASPKKLVPSFIPQKPVGQVYVAAIGKAAASMAQAFEDNWDGPLSGIAITRYGHGVATRQIKVIESGHPVPDAAGQAAAQEIMHAAEALTPDDLLVCLVSGGGSSLAVLPAEHISLDEKQRINKALLKSGANISEINTVRKHLSAFKGGRLARAAYPAKVLTLIISDVPGDNPSTVASGPTLADDTSNVDALRVIKKYNIQLSSAAIAHLSNPENETLKPADPIFTNTSCHVIGTPRVMLDAVVAKAGQSGIEVIDLGSDLEGEASDLGRDHAKLAIELAADNAVSKPVLIVSGGETTVTATGSVGRGGRNSEYLLSLCIALNGHDNIHALACDTDGIDGSQDNAGAWIAPDTLSRAKHIGSDPCKSLQRHDSYSFFEAVGGLIKTGPTLTNVNDLRLVLIEASEV